jgi:hypothetical protein
MSEEDAHEVDVTWVPVCSVCWENVHQDDQDRWVHTRPIPPEPPTEAADV